MHLQVVFSAKKLAHGVKTPGPDVQEGNLEAE
jgi:hypothetical protein